MAMAENTARQRHDQALAWAPAALTALAGAGGTFIAYLPDHGLLAHAGEFGRDTLSITLAAVSWAVTGATLTTLRPGNAIGRLLTAVSLLLALTALFQAYGAYGASVADPAWPAARLAAQLFSTLWLPAWLLPYSVLLVLYPQGRPQGRRARVLAWTATAGLTLVVVGGVFSPSFYDDMVAHGDPPLSAPAALLSTAFGAGFLLLAAATLAIWADTGVRLARSRPPQRQQLAWVVAVLPPIGITTFFTDRIVSNTLSMLLPVAIGVGVLRYRLLGIDLVLRRWLVYGTLTAAVVAAYLGTTALAGATLGHGVLPGVVAAALVAMGLAPLRDRLQRAVDRFVYGDRRDPLRALARVGDRLATGAEEADGGVLTAVLTATAEAVRAPGAELLGSDGELLARCGARPTGSAPAADVPLKLSGTPVGTLRIADRTTQEPYTAADLKVLHALAPSMAAAVRADALAQELAAERDRVIDATRAERDRFRRDLHDGLGPALMGIALALQVAADSLDTGDGATTRRMVGAARTEADASGAEVRRIIQDLRPGTLDRLDLLGALRERARSFAPDLPVRVTGPAGPALLPPDVETTAYRIACEALTNVVRHAAATRALIELVLTDDELTIRVEDDGLGLRHRQDPPQAGTGVGLDSMRARVASHGGTLVVDSPGRLGGTAVTARLPLKERS
ncbi:sensor histidine kinase [Streptomyces sp. NBC_01478]|uniref:sensor histidine kinase n=1 Tax=Streptomyces sp. NBC_01478 TaxID=2903882 RepID=UPI002E35577B|nr:sensor histidine kinase [Streptomyces sp. NBC_01478]